MKLLERSTGWRRTTKHSRNPVQKIRKAAKLSQLDFARYLGVSLPLIKAVERGPKHGRRVSSDLRERLFQRCGAVIGSKGVFDSDGKKYCKDTFERHAAIAADREAPFGIKDFATALEEIGSAAERAGLSGEMYLFLFTHLRTLIKNLKLERKLTDAAEKRLQGDNADQRIGYLIGSLLAYRRDPLSLISGHGEPLLSKAPWNVRMFIASRAIGRRLQQLFRKMENVSKPKKVSVQSLPPGVSIVGPLQRWGETSVES